MRQPKARVATSFTSSASSAIPTRIELGTRRMSSSWAGLVHSSSIHKVRGSTLRLAGSTLCVPFSRVLRSRQSRWRPPAFCSRQPAAQEGVPRSVDCSRATCLRTAARERPAPCGTDRSRLTSDCSSPTPPWLTPRFGCWGWPASSRRSTGSRGWQSGSFSPRRSHAHSPLGLRNGNRWPPRQGDVLTPIVSQSCRGRAAVAHAK